MDNYGAALEALIVMQCRIYDVLMVIARAADEESARRIEAIHEAGDLVNDEIALRGKENNEKSS